MRDLNADSRIRTSDLLITNELLCQLSYAGIRNEVIIPDVSARFNAARQ